MVHSPAAKTSGGNVNRGKATAVHNATPSASSRRGAERPPTRIDDPTMMSPL